MSHEPTYKQAIHHASKMIWDHKLLWPIGLFATLLGQMGLFEMVSKFSSALSQKNEHESWGNLPEIFISSFRYVGQIVLPFTQWVWSVWLWIIIIGIAAALLFVSIVSQGALVHTTSQKHKFQIDPDISKAWHTSVRHFGRLLSVHLLRKIFIIGLTILIGKGTIAAVEQVSSVSTLGLVVILLVSLSLGFILSCLSVYAVGYIVVEEQPFFLSVKNAWMLFRQHLLVSFEVGFLVLMGNILVLILAIAGSAVLLTPVFLVNIFWSLVQDSVTLFLISTSSVFCFLVYLAALGSFYTIWSTSLWTYLFMRMHSHGIESRLVHHIARILSRA